MLGGRGLHLDENLWRRSAEAWRTGGEAGDGPPGKQVAAGSQLI